MTLTTVSTSVLYCDFTFYYRVQLFAENNAESSIRTETEDNQKREVIFCSHSANAQSEVKFGALVSAITQRLAGIKARTERSPIAQSEELI